MNHLLSIEHALTHPVTVGVVVATAVALVLTPLVTGALSKAGRLREETRRDILLRWRTWLILAPGAIVPILLCPLSAMLLVCVLSLLCYREFARATGVFRERLLSVIVVLGILLLTFASIDFWYGLFVALGPLTITMLSAGGVVSDRPKGYIQRVALAAVGFLLFGLGLAHLGFMANDREYRPILCLLIASAQASDILAYCCGKAFGRRNIFPNTSPNKTLGGHLGALVLVTPLSAWMAHLVFRGTELDTPVRLIGLGLIIGLGAQLGDLVLGSIKRDLGVKDLAATLPGHGGFSDRCNSLLLIAPAAFHYIGYFVGFGTDRLPKVFF